LITKSDKKRLLSNFFSLVSLQGVNYILPLLTFPYLVRVLGVEYFGLLAFATAIITYFTIITDYGFNLTATREISVHRDNKEKVIEIFSAVMSIQFMLMLLSFLLLVVLVFSFERFSKDWEVYFITFGIVIGQMLFPVWFFQGMERMKYITYLNIFAKSIFTVAIFIFVKEQNDFYLVPLFTSIGFILAGILSLVIIQKEFKVKFVFQPIDTIKYYLFDGWYLFKTRIFVSLYTVTNIFLLGVFTNNTVVGFYSIAERIVNAVGGLFTPANQAIYPFMTKLYQEKKILFVKFVRKISFIYISISSVLFILMYLFGRDIVELINGTVNSDITDIYFILVFLIFTVPFGALYAQVLVTRSENKKISEIVRDVAILNIVLVPICITLFGAMGMAIVVVLLQYYIVIRYYITIYKGL